MSAVALVELAYECRHLELYLFYVQGFYRLCLVRAVLAWIEACKKRCMGRKRPGSWSYASVEKHELAELGKRVAPLEHAVERILPQSINYYY